MTPRKPDPERVDEDGRELDAAWFDKARPASEVLPEILGAEVAAVALKRRGRPAMEHPKAPVKLRIDQDVLAAYRATGARWQTRMNEVLRQHMPKPMPKPKKEAQS